jgi:hypothetical protein
MPEDMTNHAESARRWAVLRPLVWAGLLVATMIFWTWIGAALLFWLS